ncbi:efflux RND transporter periplasmic adaptor subunit [Novipirellula artificiosorum]|uniref:HlyD family secretion protein n=1 Tax=Novipirellula artificiosorum TaxID=2528016 RepID=A0A5C6D6T9_9BACT|nr:biotin/lipoyl-binding protein [Novipirellula artificiosorum]TWU31544.1 HlyD family secretion protein [Novipirellula artificiosorum]
MTLSSHSAEKVWKDATDLIDSLDQLSHAAGEQSTFFEVMAGRLRQTTLARCVIVSIQRSGKSTELARDGIDVMTPSVARDVAESISAAATSPSATSSRDVSSSHWDRSKRLVASVPIIENPADQAIRLQIDIRWSDPVSTAIQPPITEMAVATADIATLVYLKDEFTRLRDQMRRQAKNDQLAIELNRGAHLADAFTNICRVVALYTDVDRVSLLRKGSNEKAFRLIATNVAATIDPNTRLARVMQSLADAAASQEEGIHFTVGAADEGATTSLAVLDTFLLESGSRQVAAENLTVAADREANLPHATNSVVMVMERFVNPQRPSMRERLAELKPLLTGSLANAIERDEAGIGWLLSKTVPTSTRKRTLAAAAVFFVGLALMALIQVDFWVPAEGRMVAAASQSIYAPADGVVIELPVNNGDSVIAGETIAVIRSRDLESKRQQIDGEIATVESSLASIQRSRSTTKVDAAHSANEQILKAQLDGLGKQLLLVQSQQAELVVKSPIAGHIDHWNMRERLTARPVQRGQFLADVISPSQGWALQIDIDDSASGYVLEQQKTEPCKIRFSLRSQGNASHESVIQQIDEVTHQDARGHWVVKAKTAVLVREQTDSGEWSDREGWRTGATTHVEILAGRRSVGFVWFRGLIEWFRGRG